jgi:hypothetical protein
MFRLPGDRLQALGTELAKTGNRHAEDLVDALVKTQTIYLAHEGGHAYDANRERALLLKQNFVADYRRLAAASAHPPRVLLKFGENHLFRGFDPGNLADLGNFVTEFADGMNSRSLHIAVLGMHGEAAAVSAPGKPSTANAADLITASDWAFLRPLFAAADRTAFTAFDLRPLRPHFAALGPVDRELERLVFGYDLVVLMPTTTAATEIE